MRGRHVVASHAQHDDPCHRREEITDLRGADFAAIIRRLETAGKIGAADDFRARCRTFPT
jgi:hypothetical protein